MGFFSPQNAQRDKNRLREPVVVSHDASACSSEPAAPGERRDVLLRRGKRVPVCLSFVQVLTCRNRIDELQKQ